MSPGTPPLTTRLRQAVQAAGLAGLADGPLLERYVADGDQAAFAVLVQRHGPMVLGVCRRLLHNLDDAEDAFQATFLVLVRRAASVRPRERVGCFLHGVARRTALRARADEVRRRAKERAAGEQARPEAPADVDGELWSVLDAELTRLPEVCRAALVLCDLEGLTHREAARRLGWPEGTLSTRLARGRRLLAARLGRMGFAPAALAAPAALPPDLAAATLQAAASTAAVPARVAVLVKGEERAMLLTRLKLTAALLGTLGVTLAGVLSLAPAAGQGPDRRDPPAQVRDAPEKPRPPDEPHEVRPQPMVALDIWTLDVRFKDPRSVSVNVPGQGRKTYVYLVYEVVNRTGGERRFIPDLELVGLDRPVRRRDEVVPAAFEAIRQLEDPAGRLNLLNSVTISKQPVPPSAPGAAPKAVWAVAMWEAPGNEVNRCSVFIAGLTNAWSVDESGKVRRKTLQLNFRRLEGDWRFVDPPQWLYRSEPLRPQEK
jgi:RNA polymerase sigma factor (sigma-70 family)